MHVLHPPTLSAPASSNATLLSLPKPSIPTSHDLTTRLPWRLLATTPTLFGGSAVACYQSEGFRSEEFPVDDSYLEEFAPKDKETEDEARRSNWIDRDWAPWEEILTPEGDFARKSLNEGEEVPLKTPEALEAFRMLSPKYRRQKMKELGLTEDEFYAKQFEIKGEIPEPLVTTWGKPMVVRLMPPRDWPPRGWDVDRKELEFIREAHKLMAVRVDFKEVEKSKTNTDDMCLDRYKVFLKQYKEWVAHNKERLEEESYKYDQDYHPGRRKRGKDYQEGMYELPFYYPGQICAGKVTTLHLYQGAFVDIGGVYEGWVPIKGNDWFWIRHHIKVGMSVTVEILAKRDPYRFRFPIEMRFVDPNIDHLIFRRFEYPPIFHHAADTNPDELLRDCGRPPIPRKRPINKVEEEPLRSDHPYVERLVLLHNAEQLILDDMEEHPEKYKGKKLSDLADDDDYSEENSVEYTEVLHENKTPLQKVIMRVSVKDLDLEAALAERELHNKLKKEADERGEYYKVSKLRRNIEMDEHDLIHWRRSYEEREALLRDISCRKALGLPLEEPRRYVDARILDKGKFDPTSPLYRHDYLGEIKNSEESRKQQIAEAHNKSIFGNGTLWHEMSLEDAIKPRMQREARSKAVTQETPSEKDEEDEYDDDNFDFTSIFHHAAIDLSNERVVNGTESPSMQDGSMFED